MQNEKIIFSVMMCVYNRIELLDKAVNSVIDQEEASWELLILDNSDSNKEETWKLLQGYAGRDDRIHIFRTDKNEGWAKGTARLMKYAKGMYVTFLAADDFLQPQALYSVKCEIEELQPDIVWVGNGFYQYNKDDFYKLGQSVLENKIYIDEKHSSNIRYVMENTFFNAMFHYERLEFLRSNSIDFYEPYYGDCVGMVKALSEAERMVVLNEEVYGLTSNTSRSRGTFYWDGDEYIFSQQWGCIKHAYVKDRYFSFQDARYCAMAILKNEIGNINSLVNESVCVNKEMNPVNKSAKERFNQIQKILESARIQEMAQFYGRFEYESEMLKEIHTLCNRNKDSMTMENNEKTWLGELVDIRAEIGSEKAEKVIDKFYEIVTEKNNVGMFGMGAFFRYIEGLSDQEVLTCINQIQRIIGAYNDWKNQFIDRVWQEFNGEKGLEGQNRKELAVFCKYVMDN